MHIQSVLSHLGAWETIGRSHQHLLDELQNGLAITPMPLPLPQRSRHEDVFSLFISALGVQGWNSKPDSYQFGRTRYRVDLVKQNIAIELVGGNLSSALMFILARMPIIVRANPDLVPIVMLASRDLSPYLADRTATFEEVAEVIQDLHPLPFMHPFALIGFGATEKPATFEELTSELDSYLFQIHKMTLEDMALKREHPEYDFKVQLPDNKITAKEICALANLQGGGSILLGVADNGEAVGVLNEDLDGIQLTIGSIASTRCSPVPEIEFRAFPLSADPRKSVLVVRVSEIPEKPCMSDDRVFVRYGTSARPAKPEEIRRLLLK